MHPAPSVIVFTTLSGLGFGMMVWLGLGFGPSGAFGAAAGLLALAIAGAGLVASTFHLGNPQRAIKAFSQWRSSWLSREGVISVVLMTLFFAHVTLEGFGAGLPILGWLSALLALGAVYCTAMIYAQLKTVPRWSSPWTVPMFLGASQAGGILAVALARAAVGEEIPRELGLILLLGAVFVYAYRRQALAATLASAGHSPESATQLGGIGSVRLLESPHSSPNYLMKEMVFSVGRKHADTLALIGAGAGLFAPILLFALFRGEGGPEALRLLGLTLAICLHVGGVLAYRWLFFAEAEHVVGLYYGRR